MNKLASGFTKALSRTKILNISKNQQAPITPQQQPETLLTAKNNMKDSINITKGNITGQYKRQRSFCTSHQKRYFSTSKNSSQTLRANYNYNSVTETHLEFFKTILGEACVVTDRDDCKFSSTDWFRRYIGDAACVLYPKTTEQVSQVIKFCNDNLLAVVPQGGNTGLVGGGTPVKNEIILNLRKMNKILNFDTAQGILECEAGCVLPDLMNNIGEQGYEIPFDIPARGSCTIGGNVATHAGGINFVKHGPLRANVLGLEVVLANGKVLDMMARVRKDSTGPDLKQFFIQSEGTLGLITKVSLQCAPLQKEKKVAILDVSSYAHVPETLRLCQSTLGRSQTGFEYMDGLSYELSHKVKHKLIDFPFKPEIGDRLEKWYCVIEISGEDSEELTDLFGNLAETLENRKILQNMFVSENLKQFSDIWDIRDSMGEAQTVSGLNISLDVSLDINKFQDLVNLTRNLVKDFDCVIDVLGFGHVGDGNLHLCVLLDGDEKLHEVEGVVDEYVVEYVMKLGGSISAEHGVGVMKAGYLERVKGKDVMECVRDVKMMFDPNNILNSGKVFDKF